MATPAELREAGTGHYRPRRFAAAARRGCGCGCACGRFLVLEQARGRVVRGGAAGRAHPMDFAPHEWLRAATAWVVRAAMAHGLLAVLAAAANDPATDRLLGFFVRKEKKKHGMGRQLEGGFAAGQVVALLEAAAAKARAST